MGSQAWQDCPRGHKGRSLGVLGLGTEKGAGSKISVLKATPRKLNLSVGSSKGDFLVGRVASERVHSGCIL